MFERLRTLAISVESTVVPEAAAAGDKTFWIILIAALIVVTIVLAVVCTKFIKKYKVKREAKKLNKAERKRIQSKRK